MRKVKIRFEDLPPRGVGRPADVTLKSVAQQLMERPKEWAVIRTCNTGSRASSAARSIRAGEVIAFRPRGHFEAAGRTVNGEHRVYARYVGPAE